MKVQGINGLAVYNGLAVCPAPDAVCREYHIREHAPVVLFANL